MGSENHIDAARFPSLAAYVDALPDGLASYPDCRSKGTLLRSSLDHHDTEDMAKGIGPVLADILRSPPPAGVWAPAVYNDALFHAACDLHYPSDEAMLRWCRDRTDAMANNPLYRAIIRLPTPRMIVSIASRFHDLFQRGTTLTVIDSSATHANARLSFPPHLHSRLNALSNVAMFEVLLEQVNAKRVRVTMTEQSPTHALYACRWRV